MSGAPNTRFAPGTALVTQVGAEEKTAGPDDQKTLSVEDLEATRPPVVLVPKT